MYHHLVLYRMLWERKAGAEGQGLAGEAKLLLPLRCTWEINMVAKVSFLKQTA